jgi:hypothetical protein
VLCYASVSRLIRQPSLALKQAAQIGGLSGMLQIVRQDTDEPHSHRWRWLPLGLIKHTVKICRGQPTDLGFGLLHDAVVVVQQALY